MAMVFIGVRNSAQQAQAVTVPAKGLSGIADTDSVSTVRQSQAEAIVARYVRFISGESDSGFEEMLAADFLDHVSGQRGGGIWAQVAAWSQATFADPEVAVHEVMVREDRVMVWMTVTVTHVGSAFPRLRDVAVTHKRVPWDQVHVFRIADAEISEHWAVRDDYAMVEALVGAGPLAGPTAEGVRGKQ